MTVTEAISALCRIAEDEGRHPVCALSIEVVRMTGMSPAEVEMEAERLAAEGKIYAGRTINYRYYKIIR